MKIAVVDIETTDFLNEGGLIVEIGIVVLNLKTGEVRQIYDELVKEDGFEKTHERSWIFHNSDLTHEEVMKAESLDKNKIQRILNQYPATAYNKRFDFDFLKDRGLEINELPCPMILATDICKIPHVNGYGYKWPKVQEVWDFLFGETGYIEKHRGVDDAEHEALIVLKLYEMGIFEVAA